MPLVTRRYQFMGPSATDLAKYVSSTAAVAATFQGPIIDISVDNSQPGATDALDEYMATLNFQFSPAALAPTTSVIPYAPLEPIPSGTVAYIAFGASSPTEDLANWVAPRSGVLQSFQIDVTANNLTATTAFVIQAATGVGVFGSSTMSIDVPAGTTGSFNSTGPVPLNAGDRVSLQVTTTGAAGSISFTGSVDFS